MREGLAADGAAVGARTPGFVLRKGGKRKQDARVPGKDPRSPRCARAAWTGWQVLPVALGDTGVAGSGVVHVPRPPALSPAPGTWASPGGPSARVWPAGVGLWVGTGVRRYGHTWGCTYKARAGLHTHGHMQGHADTGTRTLAHTSELPGCGHRGACTGTHGGTPAQAYTLLHAHACTCVFHRVSTCSRHTQALANTLPTPCAHVPTPPGR